MRNIMAKELRLSASPLAFLFIAFGFMFFVPGYPILCGAFFVTLGLFHSFQFAREANDISFSALLPIAKSDVVKGKYLFTCFIECCGFLTMLISTLIRMTALAVSPVYAANALMAANPFALGMALIIFGLFNWLFVGGFFKTAYNQGRPFVTYIAAAFGIIVIAEALHHVPGLAWLNATGTAHWRGQLLTAAAGLTVFCLMTVLSCRAACARFEKVDL